jgi:putative DNA primase/helicase
MSLTAEQLAAIAAKQQHDNREAARENPLEPLPSTPPRSTPLEGERRSSEPTVSPAVVRCMSDVQPVPVQWLWPGRIARGKVTLIAGDPGLGKSQLTATLAACVSAGGSWPVDRAACPRGNVLILNAEDDAADTIRPRLDAAGADVSRVHVVEAVREFGEEGRITERAFNLVRDLDTLKLVARNVGNVVLVVVDPISAYLGGTDTHRNADVRAVLAPLSALAGEIGAAIIAVSHLNKAGGYDANMRVTGSIAFVAAARAAYLVVRDPQDPSRRFFLNTKNNLGPDQGNGLAFRVASATLDNGIATSRLQWEATPVALTANEALTAIAGDPAARSALTDAMDFLQDVLANGPASAREVQDAARAAGHSRATLQRAKNTLGIVADKEGFLGGWRWSLPSKMFKSPEGAQARNVSTFGKDEHLRGEVEL